MKNLILLFTCLILVSSCESGFKKTLGLHKQSPNEFAVIRQPPLSMPPGDYLLSPSEQGASSAQVVQNETGEEILLGKQARKTQEDRSLSSSDRGFIEKTKHINKNERIKEVLNEDTKEKAVPKKKSLLNLFKSSKKEEVIPEAPIVNEATK